MWLATRAQLLRFHRRWDVEEIELRSPPPRLRRFGVTAFAVADMASPLGLAKPKLDEQDFRQPAGLG
jgi:hypothetical protein